MSISANRLSKEYNKIQRIKKRAEKMNKKLLYNVWLIDGNIKHWGAKIIGPKDTPFEDGIYVLDMIFSDKYPFSPPNVSFKTNMFHPNISNNGEICLDILKDKWTPGLKVESILLSLQSFLNTPEPDDPLSNEVAKIFRKDKKKYNEKVIEFKKKYCSKNMDPE
jgi:ubiquitin-protein ligase